MGLSFFLLKHDTDVVRWGCAMTTTKAEKEGLGWRWDILLTSYIPTWKHSRNFFSSPFSSTAHVRCCRPASFPITCYLYRRNPSARALPCSLQQTTNECTKVWETRQGSSHFHLNTRLPFIHLKPQDVFIHSGTRGDTFNAHREFNFRSFITVVVCVSCWKTPNEWNFQLNFSIIVVVAPVERWTKRRQFPTRETPFLISNECGKCC